MKTICFNTYKISAIFLFILLLTSCSKKPTLGPGERAIAKWSALIEYDWKKAYSFQSPSYRKNYSVAEYRGSFGQAVLWKKIDLKSIKTVNSNITDVTLTLIFEHVVGNRSLDLPSDFTERWQLIDGTWWHIKKD